MSNVFSGSIRALVGRAQSALTQGQINVALRLVHDFVERIITEPVCTSQVFASHELDQLCLLIGRQSLLSIGVSQEYPRPLKMGQSRVIYIVSRLQRSGGHSRLVQNFIRAQPEKEHIVLSTEVGGPSNRDYFADLFAENNNVKFLYAPRSNLQLRLTWLQKFLQTNESEHIHLFNHHQDSVAVAAVAALVSELGLIGSFYHHGDHHLCLGVHLEHLAHVDLHPMGYHYCRDELGIDNRYLPLTFHDWNFVPVQSEVTSSGCLTTATAASSNKLEIPYYVSYLDVIPQVLKVTGGRHIHMGKLTPWALRRLRAQMANYGLSNDRFVYIEWTPSVWQSLQQLEVDIYIASFPYGAGLTLIEAMGAGVPVIMHRHMYSRVLSGLELSYPEAFSWADPDALLEHLALVSPESLHSQKLLSRKRYEVFHRPEILMEYLKDPKSFKLPVPPLVSGFKPRYDEWAAWIVTQFRLRRVAYQFSYRTWRKLRSFLS